MRDRGQWAVVVIAGIGSAASAQQAQCLLRTGQLLTDASGQSRPIHRITGLTANGATAMAASVELTRLHGPSAVWGRWSAGSNFVESPGGGANPDDPQRSAIERDATTGAIDRLTYSSQISNRPWSLLPEHPGFLDSIWVTSPSPGTQCVAMQGLLQPESVGTLGYWTWLSSPASGAAGQPIWHGGQSEAAGGLSNGDGVFAGVGTGITRLIGVGDSVAGGFPITDGLSIRRFAVSPSGAKTIAVVRTLSSVPELGEAVIRVRDNAEGDHETLLSLGQPAAADLPGRYWTRFGSVVVSDAVWCGGRGHWAVAGEISASPDRDSVVALDGEIHLREGQEVGGTLIGGTLIGGALAVDMSAAGDLAVVWAVRTAPDATQTHLFFNGTRVFGFGDSFTDSGETRVVTHVYPILALGDSVSGDELPVYVVVQSVDGSGAIYDAVVRLLAAGLPPRQCVIDLNGDGVPDQSDVEDMIEIIAGMPPPAGFDPDFNCDGVPDQNDIVDFIMVVGGAPCP